MNETILSIEAIAAGLAKERVLADAAKATGIAYQQVWRIARGVDTNIRYDNLKTLSDYIQNRDAQQKK